MESVCVCDAFFIPSLIQGPQDSVYGSSVLHFTLTTTLCVREVTGQMLLSKTHSKWESESVSPQSSTLIPTVHWFWP